MSTPYRFHSPIVTINYELAALETQIKATYQAYRAEQSGVDPQDWALAAYRKRLGTLGHRRRQHKEAAALLRLESAGTE